MNDSLEKAAFGRKHLRRRSSLFFKNAEIDNVITDDLSEVDCCNNSNEKRLEEQVVTAGRKQRRASMQITYEPPPLTLKPILMSAVQKTARRLTMKAKGWNKYKRVHFHSTPNVYDISPRSGKIPGVVKMPDSPPIIKESVISEVRFSFFFH
ncbi:unnamed protein product [Onchocerca flexuosa]|uniref:Uncharacterized protein n=1 Tax=Onchocerca flexuosa TaxID=387005 RepID=A0A183I6Z1_9BILA|nr:unnamed protein product [Onchocerca flexuosa]